MHRLKNGILLLLTFTVLESLIPAGESKNNRSKVNIKDYPYMALVQKDAYDHALGSFVSRKFVLTVAHRFDSASVQDLSNLDVHPLDLLWEDLMGAEVVQGLAVAKIHIHPEYKPIGRLSRKHVHANNIAILELEDHHYDVKTIPRFRKGEELSGGTSVRMVKYGADGGRLKVKSVPIVQRRNCQNVYKGVHKLAQDQICAGKLEMSVVEACGSDNGLPLVMDNRQLGVLLGYAVEQECHAEYDGPMLYASVAYHDDWISSTIGEESIFSSSNYVVGIAVLLAVLLGGYLGYTKLYRKIRPRSPRS